MGNKAARGRKRSAEPPVDSTLPTSRSAFERLLERPRRLHRLATTGLLLAALIVGVDAFARATPGGLARDVLVLTYLFDLVAWIVVILAATAEAFIAGMSAPRLQVSGRPHYLIVFVVGLAIAAVFLLLLLFFGTFTPEQLGLPGRLIKAATAGMLPLVTGVALTAGLTMLWIGIVRPRIEAHLEAQIREYERKHEAEGRSSTADNWASKDKE